MDAQLKLFPKKIYLDLNVQKKHCLKITLQSCIHVKLSLSISFSGRVPLSRAS